MLTINLFTKQDIQDMINQGLSLEQIQDKIGFTNIGQGFGYKNLYAWKLAEHDFYWSDILIVYIPEYCYDDNTKQINLDSCYTRRDFEILYEEYWEETNGDSEYMTIDDFFEACDWQHPSSLLNEM